jgi:hypothetical protein
MMFLSFSIIFTTFLKIILYTLYINYLEHVEEKCCVYRKVHCLPRKTVSNWVANFIFRPTRKEINKKRSLTLNSDSKGK